MDNGQFKNVTSPCDCSYDACRLTMTTTLSQRTTGFLTRLSVTKGKLSASQASMPPSSGRTLVMPLARSNSATRALVASLGHEQ